MWNVECGMMAALGAGLSTQPIANVRRNSRWWPTHESHESHAFVQGSVASGFVLKESRLWRAPNSNLRQRG